MRVTQSMLSGNTLRNISKSYEQLGKYMDQLTGNKISKASDDPVVAQKGIRYRSNLTEVEQYQRNLSEMHLWIDNSEAGMKQGNDALNRIRDLILDAKNGTKQPEDQAAIADEIRQLKQDLISVANTQVTDRYIFNGTDISSKPVTDGNPPIVTQNTGDYLIEVSPGIKLKANINPNNVFSQDLFNTVNDIENALSGANPDADLDALLTNLDKVMDTFSAERSDLGARSNRLDMVEDRLSQQYILANKVLSDNEDTDVEKVITELTIQKSVNQAALQAGASIMQITLMDFLR